LQETRYEGPTGIAGVFQSACVGAGIPAVTFWAAVRAARLVPAVVRRQARIPAKPALRALRVIPAILGRPADTVVRRSATSL
uniref:PAC2 family protein n=1 Tax=Mycobacterium tuberculosis TaxID=1773 RepID=UPI0035AB71FD